MSPEFDALNVSSLSLCPEKLYRTRPVPLMLSVLLQEFASDKCDPYYSGLQTEEAFSPDYPEDAKREVYKTIGCHLLKIYETEGRKYGKERWLHAQRREVLEKAIRLLAKADQNDPEVLLHLGKAHLHRSRIIRPKGFTIPAKKTEGLFKALEYFRRSSHEKANHYAGVAALELDRCGKNTDNLIKEDHPEKEKASLYDLLSKATEAKLSAYSDEQVKEFFQMRVRLEELKDAPDYDNPVFRDLFDEKKYGDTEDLELELERYKIALLGSEPDRHKQADAAYTALMKQLALLPFSHPLWEDSVRFVRRLYKDRPGKWRKPALEMWKIAKNNSIVTSSVHLRWYWSRQRNLYDLAFLAALEPDEKGFRNISLAAEIADSAKNRPALTWQAIERMRDQCQGEKYEKIHVMLENEINWSSDALCGNYIKDEEFKNRNKQTGSVPLRKFPKNPETSALVLQFYLVHLFEDEKKNGEQTTGESKQNPAEENRKDGYVLVYDGKKKQWNPEIHRFDFRSLWDAYVQWQTVYYHSPRGERRKSGDMLSSLQLLCLEMGKSLSFLFKEIKHDKLVFVPHDFLHRIPLHGAMLSTEDVLLEKYRCTYLPTLYYAKKNRETPLCTPAQTYGNRQTRQCESVSIKYFPQNDKHNDCYKDIGKKFTYHSDNAGKEDMFAFIRNKPVLAAFFCHGEADFINPFNSQLKLKETLSFLELASAEENFSGCDIFLSACESDLSPPIDAPLDEHLSVSSVFFNKDACSVMGTVYELSPLWTKVKDLVENLFLLPVHHAFHDVQKKLWKEYKNADPSKKAEKLYHCLTCKLYFFD